MKKVLFVCTGNTCRSPMAQALFDRYAVNNGIDAVADSAGLATADGLPVSQNAVNAMQELGIDISSHRAKSASKALLAAADLIVCMSNTHLEMLKAYGYQATVLGRGIPDPYGGSLDQYRLCRDEMNAAMDSVARLL